MDSHATAGNDPAKPLTGNTSFSPVLDSSSGQHTPMNLEIKKNIYSLINP